MKHTGFIAINEACELRADVVVVLGGVNRHWTINAAVQLNSRVRGPHCWIPSDEAELSV